MHIWRVILLGGVAVGAPPLTTRLPITSRSEPAVSAAPSLPTQSAQLAPALSDANIAAALKSRGLTFASWMKPERLSGDFDGDGKPDVALPVAHAKSKKRGILIMHAGRTVVTLIGAGVNFGNGGDDFEWANRWVVVKRKGKADALLVEREESGGGLVEFVGGKYRWRQRGD